MKKMADALWYVYALECRDGSWYTGVTTDTAQRVKVHNQGKAAAYTRSRLPAKLIFSEKHPNRSSALKREAQIKALSRSQKEKLFFL